MKLIYFKSKNFKNLDIEFTFDGQSVVIQGKNGTGKSSIIDAIRSALGLLGTVKEPIKRGKKNAENVVHIELDKDYTVNDVTLEQGTILVCERVYGENSTSMSVTPKGSKALKKPADLLKILLGIATIPDPSELVNMKPMEQKAFVEKIIGVDTTAIAAKKRKALDTVLLKEQALAGIKVRIEDYKDVPKEKLKERLMTEVEVEQKLLKDNIAVKVKLDQDIINGARALNDLDLNVIDYVDGNKDIVNQIADLKEKIANAEGMYKENEIFIANAKVKREVMNAVIVKLQKQQNDWEDLPSDTVTKKVQEINDHNKLVQKQQDKIELSKNLDFAESQLDAAKEAVTIVEDERLQLLKGKKLPAGLEITDDGILFESLPITPDQLSEAKCLELWMDVLIAMHPNLKVIWFKHGSAFDSETKERIIAKADSNDYMLLMEEVTDDEEVSIKFIQND